VSHLGHSGQLRTGLALPPVVLFVGRSGVLPLASAQQRFAADTAYSDTESGGHVRPDALPGRSPADPEQNNYNSYECGVSVADKSDRPPLDW